MGEAEGARVRTVEEKVDVGYSAPDRRKILWSLKHGQPTRTPFKSLWQTVALKQFDLIPDGGTQHEETSIPDRPSTTDHLSQGLGAHDPDRGDFHRLLVEPSDVFRAGRLQQHEALLGLGGHHTTHPSAAASSNPQKG